MTTKKSPNVYKKWPKTDFTRKMKDFDTFNKSPKNVAIRAKYLLPQAKKSCPKCNKSPNMVTLDLLLLFTLMQVNREKGIVTTRRSPARRVKMRAQNPGPSGSAEMR